MKKIITSAAMGSLFFAAAMADRAVVTAEEEQPIIKEACDTECNESSFGGINIIAGITGDFSKVKETDSFFRSKHVNRVGGTIGIEYGVVCNDSWYIGGVAYSNFMNSRNYAPILNDNLDLGEGQVLEAGEPAPARVKVYGCTPGFGVRVGRILSNNRTMVYIRPAIVYTRYGFGIKQEDNSIRYEKKYKPAFGIVVGAEQQLSGKWSLRAEAGYVGNAKPKFKDIEEQDNPYKFKANGYNLTALIAFNPGR